jgi:predicted DNA-binding transcriptional regulator YafY
MARMLEIHERIQKSHFPNCNRMAKEFEVSSRTVKRDIDFMKCRLNLPIEYDSQRYGYYYTAAVEQFPSLPLSEAEAFALLVAQKAIRQYQGTPFEEPLETAYRRLIGQLNQGQSLLFEHLERGLSFRPFAPDDGDLEKFGAIYQGLSQHHQLRFRYRNLGATRTLVRHVNPYHLACVESHWYLFAFDLRREAMRTFVLTRMTDVQVSERTFPPPTDFDPNEYLKGSFSVFKGSDDYEVVIDFDHWAADLIRGRRWHASQELLELPKGSLRMRLRLNNIEEIERFVLSWGTHATVVRPKALVSRLRQISKGLHDRYSRATSEVDSAVADGKLI